MDFPMTALKNQTECHCLVVWFFFFNAFIFIIAAAVFCHNFKPCGFYLQEPTPFSYGCLLKPEGKEVPPVLKCIMKVSHSSLKGLSLFYRIFFFTLTIPLLSCLNRLFDINITLYFLQKSRSHFFLILSLTEKIVVSKYTDRLPSLM